MSFKNVTFWYIFSISVDFSFKKQETPKAKNWISNNKNINVLNPSELWLRLSELIPFKMLEKQAEPREDGLKMAQVIVLTKIDEYNTVMKEFSAQPLRLFWLMYVQKMEFEIDIDCKNISRYKSFTLDNSS